MADNIYKKSGVDVNAGYEVVEKIKTLLKAQSKNSNTENMGMFAGMYDISKLGLKKPILFSATDGVGTKVLLASKYGIDKIGQDLVAMCVNDLICHGAKPLYFLDYIAVHKVDPSQIQIIIKSILETLKDIDCELIGGETAEMQRVYRPSEFDLAGFAVGACEKDKIIYNDASEVDDIIIGLESSGLHSNGYSLIHHLIEENKINLNKDKLPSGKTIIKALLEPTLIYVNAILELIAKTEVKGLANNTGGGISENLARALSNNCDADIDIKHYPELEIYNYLETRCKLSKKELFTSLNMGIGFFIIINPKNLKIAQEIFKKHGLNNHVLGKIIKGNKKVILNW